MVWNDYKRSLTDAMDAFTYDDNIERVLRDSIGKNQTIFTCGNGGSAAIASHLACDLNKGANRDWANNDFRYRAISLSDATPHIMALANDTHYDRIFVEQLRNLAKPNDILFAISSSGNSPNVVLAAEYARDRGMHVIGLTGLHGGKLHELAHYKGHVKTTRYEEAEDVHQAFCHALVQHLREK